MTTLLLARVQFAITISFHILFPAFSIGLATYLVIIEGLWLKTKQALYYQSARFWGKVLALTFGMGIISGLAMQFQIGTNWAGFSRIVGPVLGVLFTLEVLSAFFIEATFLGVMLFGWERVSNKLHYLATCMVFVGVTLSAFWIIAANSWMQTPTGVHFMQQRFVVDSWRAVIFNPMTLIRYGHMLIAAYIATACVILAVASFYLLHQKHHAFARSNARFALISLVLLMPLQIGIGDELGYRVHEYQPLKTAAIEANWHTQRGAPLLLLADIDQAGQRNHTSIAIPHLASLLNTHHWNGTLQGLTTVPKALQPDVWITFYSFRLMVGVGILLFIVSLYSVWCLWRQRFWQRRWLQRGLTWLAPLGFLGILTGWYTAESGRQPWVVYQLLKTSNGVSAISHARIVWGFVIILIVYGGIFGVGYLTYLLHTIRVGPQVTSAHQ